MWTKFSSLQSWHKESATKIRNLKMMCIVPTKTFHDGDDSTIVKQRTQLTCHLYASHVTKTKNMYCLRYSCDIKLILQVMAFSKKYVR